MASRINTPTLLKAEPNFSTEAPFGSAIAASQNHAAQAGNTKLTAVASGDGPGIPSVFRPNERNPAGKS
jgi:hypothetical protein